METLKYKNPEVALVAEYLSECTFHFALIRVAVLSLLKQHFIRCKRSGAGSLTMPLTVIA